MNSYIVLTDSESNAYRFRVIFAQRGYRPARLKASNIQRTVSGKVDHQVGPVTLEWRYAIKAYETDPVGGNYGTLSDLEGLFDLTDPNGTPTNVLTLEDHYENTHSVYIVGTFEPEPKTPRLSGTDAWFRVPIHLVKTAAES